jgi:1,4-dihydroxy-2-naphthoate octaprenyltransferase
VPFASAVALAATTRWTLLALLALPLAVAALRRVARGATGAALIPSLRDTGLLTVAYGALLAIGLALG